MTVTDTVNKHLNAYPTLYLTPTWEDSKFAILHHMFIVLGNGVEWAKVKNPKRGGYLTDPSHYRRKGEWIRRYDQPYGAETCALDARLFAEPMYTIYSVDPEWSKMVGRAVQSLDGGRERVFESELPKGNHLAMQDAAYHVGLTHVAIRIKGHCARSNPYPNFKRKYSCFWEIKPNLIQDDWRQAGIEHLTYWQTYFNDPANVERDAARYTADGYRKQIESSYKGDGWIKAAADAYEWPAFDGQNYVELAAAMYQQSLDETRTFLTDTIARLSI